MGQLPPDLFLSTPLLTYLSLWDLQLTELDPRLFRGLTSLSEMSADQCGL